MNFIKKIFIGNVDDLVHKQFVRCGKGEFERAYIKIDKQKNSFKIKTSFEFSNDLVELAANNIKKADVSGVIISNDDFEKELKFDIKSYKKKGKLYIAEIKTILTRDQLKKLYEKFKNDYLFLTIKSDNINISCTTSLPKPGKELKDNFCKAILPINLLDEFTFDIKKDFSKLSIKHIYKITHLEIPKQYERDFTKARIYAKRKGKIIREIEIDGEKQIIEKELNI